MKFLSCEKISEHKYKTPEGYLICVDSILARTGKQTYKRSEVFGVDCKDANDEVEIDRNEKEVFSDKTLASFENKPLVVEHPDEDVNANNHNSLAVGFVRDIKRGKADGQDVMLGTLVITDAQTIEEIENGEHTDLSCGYDCDIIDEDNPQQRNIRGNHVALCQQGRAGIARIVDSKIVDDMNNLMQIAEKMKTDIKNDYPQVRVTYRQIEDVVYIQFDNYPGERPIDKSLEAKWSKYLNDLYVKYMKMSPRRNTPWNMYLKDNIKDSVKDDKLSDLRVILRSISSMQRRDLDIEDVIRTLKNAGFKSSVEKIDGWLENKNVPGEQIKNYTLNIEDLNKRVLVTFYADMGVWKTKEINAYIVDSVKDNLELPEDEDSEFLYRDAYGKEIFVTNWDGSNQFMIVYEGREQLMNRRDVEDFIDRKGARFSKVLKDSVKDDLSLSPTQKKILLKYGYSHANASKIDELLKKSSENNIVDLVNDAGLKLFQVRQGFAIVAEKYYRQYKDNAFVDRVEDSLDSARYTKMSLERNDKMSFIIIDCTQANKKKVVDAIKDDASYDWQSALMDENIKFDFIKGGYGMKFKSQNDYNQAKELAKKYRMTKGHWYDKDLEYFNYSSATISNDSIKDKLVDIPNNLIALFEKLLKTWKINIDDQGKTWSGRLHYQVSSNVSWNDFKIALHSIEQQIEAKGVPMTFSANTDGLKCTAGIDLDKMYVKDAIKDYLADPSDIDAKNYVIGRNGVWFAKPKSQRDMFDVAYCSNDNGKTWHTCYKETKSDNHDGKTQVGKVFFRTSTSFPGPRTSIGRNVLTWCANNNVHELGNYEIDHINNSYLDDRLSNLERVSHSENIKRRNVFLYAKKDSNTYKEVTKNLKKEAEKEMKDDILPGLYKFEVQMTAEPPYVPYSIYVYAKNEQEVRNRVKISNPKYSIGRIIKRKKISDSLKTFRIKDNNVVHTIKAKSLVDAIKKIKKNK